MLPKSLHIKHHIHSNHFAGFALHKMAPVAI